MRRSTTVPGVQSILLIWSVAVTTQLTLVEASDQVQFNRDVRPILQDHCFRCHGPDSVARKADLRLDQREAAIAASAFVPGKPAESEAIRRLFSKDADEVMPPPNQIRELTDRQREILRQWVADGAEYQSHWSFLAPTRPPLPAVRDSSWVRNAIDAFVLARLESSGLRPAPEADRRILARRLSLDLRGLPPAPQDVEAFVQDPSPDAYERFVDKLQESPQWGEHRARYWLDVARYADTHGIHFDNYRENWSYRDWVIAAFNRNLGFDQFTIDQLAGDLLPDRTLQHQIASGFNRCNITTNEGGIIDEEYLVLYTRDRTETVSQVWLGLTMNCTTCHDHKFDPISQRDFYEFAAFFNNTTQGAKDGNIKDTPPTVPVPLDRDRERARELPGTIAGVKQAMSDRRQAARPEFETWLATANPQSISASIPQAGLALHAPLNEGTGRTTAILRNGQSSQVNVVETATWVAGVTASHALQVEGAAVELPDFADFDQNQPFACAAWIKVPANDSSGALCARMDNSRDYRGWDFWVQGRRIGMHLIHRWPDDALKVVGKKQVPGNEWTHVAVSYDGSGKAAGVKVYYNGQPEETNVEQDRLQNSTQTPVSFKIGQRDSGEKLSGVALADLRVYQRAIEPAEVAALARNSQFVSVLSKSAEQRSAAEVDELYGWWLAALDQPYQRDRSSLEQLEQELAAIRSRGTIALVMQEKSEPASAFILFRGEYDKRRDAVQPDTPDILPPFPADVPRNRLSMAQWLLRPEHPLTARVTVNRYWQELFGAGLVTTAGDFGVAGEWPSHPELLDWLAVEFRESGWNIKQFYKLLVCSATYRQSALVTADKIERDPLNRLLSRGPRFRMDAEMVRDYALATSGLLVTTVGGPSVRPYQPDGVWEAVAMIGSNTRDYRQDTGDNLFRRSMYTFWKRSAPPASLDIFNAPSREVCTVRRDRTNTPLQSLVTLNDPQFVEAARNLAQRSLRHSPDNIDHALQWLALQLLGRPFRPAEMAITRESLDGLANYYQAHPDDARQLVAIGESPASSEIPAEKLAAWTMLANELLNLDEVLNK